MTEQYITILLAAKIEYLNFSLTNGNLAKTWQSICMLSLELALDLQRHYSLIATVETIQLR